MYLRINLTKDVQDVENSSFWVIWKNTSISEEKIHHIFGLEESVL